MFNYLLFDHTLSRIAPLDSGDLDSFSLEEVSTGLDPEVGGDRLHDGCCLVFRGQRRRGMLAIKNDKTQSGQLTAIAVGLPLQSEAKYGTHYRRPAAGRVTFLFPTVEIGKY